MVDFQSRDTRRGPSSDGDDDEDDSEASATAEAADGTTADETATETTDSTAEYGPETLPYAVVTVSDDRTVESDAAGSAVVDAIEHAGDAVATRELVAADYDGVQRTVSSLARRGDVSAIITLGGTGVSPDDVTVDAVTALFGKRLPGFGELYRVLSHDVEGTAVVRTRVTAGIVDGSPENGGSSEGTDGVPVFCLPADAAGARRGVEGIVLEEAGTIADQASAD